MAKENPIYNLPSNKEPYITEPQLREIVASMLANYTGITRFRTIETEIVELNDFTNAQHNHSSTSQGGQIGNAALSETITVAKGGTGATSLTDGGVLVGNGTSAVQVTAVGSSGQILTSNGAGSDPTFQDNYQFKNGVATRAGNTSSGSQTIAHGLGKTPKQTKIRIKWKGATAVVQSDSDGVYNGTTTSSVFATDGTGTTGTSSANIAEIYQSSTIHQKATISVDGTNITLTWTLTGAMDADNMAILWEVVG